MALTNKERIGRGLEQLEKGLTLFVERALEQQFKSEWIDRVRDIRGQRVVKGKTVEWDAQTLLKALVEYWRLIFEGPRLGKAERAFVGELLEWRNKHAHENGFSSDDVYRALDTCQRLLDAVDAREQADAVGEMKADALRVADRERARSKTRRASLFEGDTPTGLKPWREIVTPHPDVANGHFLQAEFAADLASVHKGQATAEYGDPMAFFQRTYITEGLGDLLETALTRLSGKGGDPVVELQTNFGGGKTHSMLAVYHLASGTPSNRLEGVEAVLRRVGIEQAPKATRAVLVGTDLSPGQVSKKPDGTEVRTLWGELAWQLGGEEAFARIADSDRQATAPGADDLAQLLAAHAPCLVLIDEWVAYSRQTVGGKPGPAGDFAAQASFAQNLTEAVKRVDRALVLASIPTSEVEVGGEHGKQALEVLKNVFHRVAKPWRTASGNEGFEIVRRRLFEPLPVDHIADRDAVLRAFQKLYRENETSFARECNEPGYFERMQQAYPLHPELFRRLYDDWSTLDKFQRTRGVLRLLAKVIHRLWTDQDRALLILPASIPMDDSAVKSELTSYLHDQWEPILSTDVDGEDSLPARIDRGNSNFGRYSAARRVARAMYVGTAPGSDAERPGTDAERILLGCVQPGETIGAFSDALRRLSDQGQYIHQDGNRYWISTKPNLNRTVEGKANRLLRETDKLDVEIVRRIRQQRSRGKFSGVHACPESSAEVPDEPRARLVILHPTQAHKRGAKDSKALEACRDVLANRGNSPRLEQNTLVFLAPDERDRGSLYQAVAGYLAWKEVDDEWEKHNLDAFQKNQARSKVTDGDRAVDLRIANTWVHALLPKKADPSAETEWEETKIPGGDEDLAVRTSQRLTDEGSLLPAMNARFLRLDLDKYLWPNRDHVTLAELAEWYPRYLYLSRIVDRGVLENAVRSNSELINKEGEGFAVADGYDPDEGGYQGLRADWGSGDQITDRTVLIKPEVAEKAVQQIKESAAASAAEAAPAPTDATSPAPGGPPSKPGAPSTGAPSKPTAVTFTASVPLDLTRINRDVAKINEEVLEHLATLPKAKGTVTLEIVLDIPGGVDERTEYIVTENARSLGFSHVTFELQE